MLGSLDGHQHSPTRSGENRFVVVSAGRSGSSLLVNLLNSHPQIECHGEILNEDRLSPPLLAARRPEPLLKHVVSFFEKKEGVVGAKFLTSQFDELPVSLADVLEALSQPKVIFLYRKNMLSTYVSLLIAQRNGLWYSTEKVNHESIHVEWPSFLDYAMAERRRWRTSLQQVGGPRYVLSYEGLRKDINAGMRGIWDYLGIPSFRVQATSVRQNPLPLTRKIDNYSDLPLSQTTIEEQTLLDLPEGPEGPSKMTATR